VSNTVALLAEPDQALRDLMRRTLAGAGYEVIESSNGAQLEAALRIPTVCRARNLLYVLASRLATDRAPAISAATLERADSGLPEAQLILTYEFGAPKADPDLPGRLTRGVLEKPFDLYELQAMAFECRNFLCESGTEGSSA
jgi:hypothetical protein